MYNFFKIPNIYKSPLVNCDGDDKNLRDASLISLLLKRVRRGVHNNKYLG